MPAPNPTFVGSFGFLDTDFLSADTRYSYSFYGLLLFLLTGVLIIGLFIIRGWFITDVDLFGVDGL